MRRWTRRIVYTLLILIIVALAAVQVVLWTDWPRRVLLAQVQQQLGLRVQASGMSVSWMGTTTLRDVKLSLPLASESFLDMPTMTVKHTALLPLFITRNFDLRAIELNKPNLVVKRDAAGRWNLQDVAQLIARATAGSPEPGTKDKPPRLPTFRLNDGIVAVIDDLKKVRVTISPITATGDPDGSLVWKYHLGVPDKLQVTGQVAPGEDFKHEFQFAAKPRDWIEPWIPELPAPFRIDGQWNGSLVNKNTIAGRLVLKDSQIANFGARGRVAIQTSGDDSVVTPQNLIITTPIGTMPQVEIASGTVQVHGDKITLQQMRLGAVGGLAQLDGTGDLAAKTADLSGVWQDLALSSTIAHSGNISVSIKNLFPGRPSVNGTIVTRGKAPQGAWDGQITFEGAGVSWDEMDWTAHLPRGEWKSKLPVEIADVTARVTHRGQLITLTELRWPSADRLTARGELNLRENSWLLRSRGGGTLNKLASASEVVPFDFNFDTYGSIGDVKRVHVNEIFVRARNLELRLTGDYVGNVPEPVSLSLFLNRQPSKDFSEDDLPVKGKFFSEGHIGGTLDPMKLAFKGVMRGESLVIADRPYGNIRGIVTGSADENRAGFAIADLSMLGGAWTITSVWPYKEKDKQVEGDRVLRVAVAVEHLSMADVGDLMKVAGMQGSIAGQWELDLDPARARRDQLAMHGTFSGKEIKIDTFIADRMTGEMTLRNGVLRIDPIELHRQEKGLATGSAEIVLASPTTPTVQITAEGWPVTFGKDATASAAIWAEANLQFDTKTKSANGPIKARAMLATTQQAIGEADIVGKLDGRNIALDHITLTGLQGEATGSAFLNTETPNFSTASLQWKNITGERIAEFLPDLKGLRGTYSGSMSLNPAAASDRALEPLRLKLELNPEGGAFRTIAIGKSRLSAFLNLDENFVIKRAVLDELPGEDAIERAREVSDDVNNVPTTQRTLGWNDIRIADGRLKLWARRASHPDGEKQSHIIAEFRQLDLNEIVHAFSDKADPMPGRLAGRLILHGSFQNRDFIFGDGRVEITDSDLGEVDVLKFLYDAMSLGSQPKTPNGTGSIDISLQRSTLTLNNIHYFNRGAEAWSSNLTISDIWKIPESPIEGYVVGSARPLSALKLPFLADVDQILSVLQSNLTTVHVSGTVGKSTVKSATFADVNSGLKRFLTGQVNETRGAPPPAR